MPTPPSDNAAPISGRRAVDRRRHTRRVFQIALAISVALHLLVGITVQFRYIMPDAPSRPVTVVQYGEPDNGTRVYNVVPVEGTAAPIEAQVRTQVSTAPSFIAPAGTGAGVEAPRAGGERREIDPIGDRLRPRFGRAEVWTDPDPRNLEPTDDEVVRRRIAERLAAVNDSVAEERARQAAAMDWTVRDGNGGRWGVSPGRIHLGDREVRFDPAVGDGRCLITPNDPTASCWRDEGNGGNRAVRWAELQAQANREMVRAMFDDRVRLVRERRAAERDSVRAAAGGS